MSFLKQLLTPFIEFDEDKKKEMEKSKPSPSPSATQPLRPSDKAHHPLITDRDDANITGTDNQAPTYSPDGIITVPMPEHQLYFEKLIEEANMKNAYFQGPDFKEFIDSKIDIDDITDEALKYRTAFNILKNSGISKQKLISTAEEYLNIIGRDLNNFQSAHAHLYKKELGQHETLIQKKAEELQALTQRANQLKKEINHLTQEVSLKREKLNTIKNSFLLAGEKKQNEIQGELKKITRYF